MKKCTRGRTEKHRVGGGGECTIGSKDIHGMDKGGTHKGGGKRYIIRDVVQTFGIKSNSK